MRFVKGAIVGSLVTTGVVMICKESGMGKKNFFKQGRKILRKMI